jgi:sugar phosphate isomerase/epimerase
LIEMTQTIDTAPLSLAHLSELEVPPAELIELAARAGFASVGLRTVAAAPGGIVYPLATAAEQAEIRRRTAATGVSVLYIEMLSLSDKTRASDCLPILETGAAIGATRLAVAADSPDFTIVAERLAEICDLARPYGISVDLEFMPFRAAKSFADAARIIGLANRPNAHILVDALHVFRSGSPLDEIRNADRRMLGTFQLCDAPAEVPPPDQLVTEARTRRLLPGHGGLPLEALIDALPADIPFGVEVPLAGQYPGLDALARLSKVASSTREFLKHRRMT